LRPGMCDGRVGHSRLGDRGVADAVLAEAGVQAAGDAKGAAGLGNVFAEDEDARIFFNALGQRAVDSVGKT
jgi:hypothetical protein